MTRDQSVENFAAAGHRIRDLDPKSGPEIELVASRMHQTLVEVLGEEKGGSMYTPEWLRQRVLWHLDSSQRTAKVILSENRAGQVTGHAIARIEIDDAGKEYGFFSTLYVEPESRNLGIATHLSIHVENWLIERRMPKVVYSTAETNAKLIKLFRGHGFEITETKSEMVRLEKILKTASSR